jgi:hypothetical protein
VLRRLRFLLLLIIPILLIPLLPTATAQADGEAQCAAALAAADGGARTWNGYTIVRAPQRGGTGADVVLGTDGNDDLRGGSGRDLLCGFGGNDTLWGGSNDDVLVGGPGADSLYGESGDDTLYTDAQDRSVNGGSGRNQVIQALPTPTPLTPTATPITPTATPITPTATPITPTATPITPTATPITPTATPITPTATPVTPTATPDLRSVYITWQFAYAGEYGNTCRMIINVADFPDGNYNAFFSDDPTMPDKYAVGAVSVSGGSGSVLGTVDRSGSQYPYVAYVGGVTSPPSSAVC